MKKCKIFSKKNKIILAEGKFGVSPDIKQPEDKRDYGFMVTKDFDWELGFDIELLLGYRAICKDKEEFFGKYGASDWGVDRYREIVEIVKEKNIKPFKIPPNDQGMSLSCGGQGSTKYSSVLNMVETGEWVELSPKDVYAYTALADGGSYSRDNVKRITKIGVGTQKLVPIYETRFDDNGMEIYRRPLTEKEYREKPEETDELLTERKIYQNKEYFEILGISFANQYAMDQMAWGMLLGFGTYFAVQGENGKWWDTEYPSPPNMNGRLWGHLMYGGKAILDPKDGKTPVIMPLNSWGENIGDMGWQKLKLDYFEARAIKYPLTLIDKENDWWKKNNTMIKTIKVKDESEIYEVSEKDNSIYWIAGWNSYQEKVEAGHYIPYVEIEQKEFEDYNIVGTVGIIK